MSSHSNFLFPAGRRRAVAIPIVALCSLVSAGLAAQPHGPNAQDMQLIARVIGFQDKPVPSPVRLGVVYDPNHANSADEAKRIMALLQDQTPVGGVTLLPVLIAQDALVKADRLDAVFATAGIEPALLRPALVRLQVPCLTLDIRALGPGGCMVSVQDDPSVTIVLDHANALAAHVRFATAFRMMVKEQ